MFQLFCIRRVSRGLATFALVVVAAPGCEQSLPADKKFSTGTEPVGTAEDPKQASSGLTCKPVDTVKDEQLPARGTTIRRIATPAQTVIPVGDLFEQFSSHCGGCHVDAAQGNFQASRQSFVDNVQQLALDRIRSADRKLAMPPPGDTGKLFSERPAGDPLVDFAAVLEAWLKQGKPKDGFTASQKPSLKASPYQLTTHVAMGMTNIGNCIPSKAGFGSAKTRMEELDKKFDEMKELPLRLEETDLFTLDSEVLAQNGVVGFAPAYPLWSDGAKKIRMIRVPRGKKIKFDKEKQIFDFPPNTRFYKTFLKEVIDREGNKRYRKLETRVIVGRPDKEDADVSGLERHNALFGTYAWNEQETEAILVRDPLRNGKPFRDRMITVVLDEHKVEEYAQRGITDLGKIQFMEDAKAAAHAAAEQDAGTYDAGTLTYERRPKMFTRTYAIPGSERCIHCHMGSPSKNFSLGFLPVQIKRRPKGQGGVIDATGADELGQLQRFIDYGLIEGMASPEDVLPLEMSQGDRDPRNEYELTAQGYLLGNCAHCHNPRGFPSNIAPELTDLLNFLPDGDKGGVFQFPLDRVSPRIKRGPNQDLDIPYITPTLLDSPSGYAAGDTRAKTQDCAADKLFTQDGDIINEFQQTTPVLAPWRSLIYRNVDAPFSYSDDSTIFPHMPRDTAGYDCRARSVLGSWMVSIPARLSVVLTDTDKSRRTAIQLGQNDQTSTPEWLPYPEAHTDAPQPYEEVGVDDPAYLAAELAAIGRLEKFRKSDRLLTCPDSQWFDVVDPTVVGGTSSFPRSESPHLNSQKCSVPGNLVPSQAHWFVTDLTEAAGDWVPRRNDWDERLRRGKGVERSPEVAPGQDVAALIRRNDEDRRSLYLLTGIDPYGVRSAGPGLRITTELRKFALTESPLGVWSKPECAPASSKAVSSYSAAEHPWLRNAKSDALIYSVTPGEQVFGTICANCHGPLADSRGRMADTIADLTGGATRVANLRDGLLGPLESPGQNIARVFGPAALADAVTAEDWGGRYLLWMGLGGTLRSIPPAVLTVVANSRVLGKKRTGFDGVDWEKVGANMLAVAEQLCQTALSLKGPGGGILMDATTGLPKKAEPLVATNGDQLTWVKLCTVDNPAPVRVWEYSEVTTAPQKRFVHPGYSHIISDGSGGGLEITYDGKLVPADGKARVGLPPANSLAALTFKRERYPAGTPVGDHLGRVQAELTSDNLAPWCVLPPLRNEQSESEQTFRAREADWKQRGRELFLAERKAAGLDSVEPPYCPSAFVAVAQEVKLGPAKDETVWELRMNVRDLSDWVRRGAMNAGLSVYLYLDALARGQIKRAPEYDVCPTR